MNTSTELVASETPDAPPMKQLAPFEPFKEQLAKLKSKAESLTVTDVNDKVGMKMANALRLECKHLRVAGDNRRKELVEDHLRAQQQINADWRAVLAILEPLELRLKEQEEFIEREQARIIEEKRQARTAEITPFLIAPLAIDPGILPDDKWLALLADAKDGHTARLKREEDERIAAEAEKARIAAQDAENKRLRAEAAERKRLAAIEREEAAAKLKAEQDRAAKEKAEAEAKAKKEREELQAKADAEAKRIRAEAAERERIASEKARAEAETARKERERVKADADAENARLAAIAEAQRQEAVRLAAEIAAKRAAEEKAEAARLAADKKAKAAPYKEKNYALASAVRALVVPDGELSKAITEQRDKFAAWIEKKADELL